jgi:hypothetical protein
MFFFGRFFGYVFFIGAPRYCAMPPLIASVVPAALSSRQVEDGYIKGGVWLLAYGERAWKFA